VLPAALALVVIGVILLFLIPWVGLVAGIVGVLLLIGFALGIGRRAERERT
jgi:Flp pilus assembly protein TadB